MFLARKGNSKWIQSSSSLGKLPNVQLCNKKITISRTVNLTNCFQFLTNCTNLTGKYAPSCVPLFNILLYLFWWKYSKSSLCNTQLIPWVVLGNITHIMEMCGAFMWRLSWSRVKHDASCWALKHENLQTCNLKYACQNFLNDVCMQTQARKNTSKSRCFDMMFKTSSPVFNSIGQNTSVAARKRVHAKLSSLLFAVFPARPFLFALSLLHWD